MTARQKVRAKKQMFEVLEERTATHISLQGCSWRNQSRSDTCTAGVGRQRYSIGAERIGMNCCCLRAGSRATEQSHRMDFSSVTLL